MIRSNRPIRSRLDYYASNTDPTRLGMGAGQQDMAAVGYWRSQRSVDEMRRRPEALRTGYGNLRPVGIGQPYVSGMGKPAIERDDVVTHEDGQ
jgi:hypothetical protein